jgi:hypothetical protein
MNAMAHGPHDHVHRLVHSMTPAEKRYFKLYVARHIGGQSTYRTLFDAVAAMPEYDETALLAKFPEAGFARRFTITKRRFYEALLASLDLFHAGSTVDARLRRSLHHVSILYQRALYQDAERMLRSVRDLARKHERQAVLLEVVEWDRRLMERMNYDRVQEPELDELSNSVKTLRTELEELEELWALKSRSFMLLYRRGRARDERRAEDLRALLEDPLLAPAANMRTVKARYLHHHVRSALLFGLNDLAACEDELERLNKLMEEHGELFAEEPHVILSVTSNLAYLRMRRGRFAEAMAGLRTFKQIPAMLPNVPDPDLMMKIFSMGSSLELALLCRSGDFDTATGKLAMVSEGIDKYHGQMSLVRRAGLRFQAAWASFGAGDLEQAARWCRSVLNEPGIDGLEEAHAMARMLDLLIVLETGKDDLLPYALRNTERFLKGHERAFGTEKAIFKYVHMRMKAKKAVDVEAAHNWLHQELTALYNDPMERPVFDQFDPLAWVVSKLRGTSLAQVVREQAHEVREAPAPRRRSEREAA